MKTHYSRRRFSTPPHFLLLLLALGLSSNVHRVQGYGGGAPGSKEICDAMVPKHGPNPSNEILPYNVTLSKSTAMGGETIKLTLTAPAGKPFKGFFVQVKKAGEKGKNYGKFNPESSPDLAHSVSCFENANSAMTHKSSAEKSLVNLEWIAPNEDLTDLELTVSFVESFQVFWAHHVPLKEKITVKRDAAFTTPAPPGEISDKVKEMLKATYSDCISKGCIGLPAGCIDAYHQTHDDPIPQTCNVLLTWAAEGDRNVYNLTGRPSNGNGVTTGYIAMGFSEDKKMGEDSVVGCYLTNGVPSIHRFYNPGYYNDKAPSNTLGLVSKGEEFMDGYLHCKFEQTDHTMDGINVQIRNRSYYIFLSYANSASPNSLSRHTDKLSSDSALSITDTGVFASKDSSRLLYQLHGAFMITAWLLCASTGMFTARYYKLTHTDVTPFKKAFWFVIHIFCMFSTVFLTACGAVFIVVKKEALTFKDGENLMWHPILGVILCGLAIFQVLLAFLRPHPGTSRRPIFNWIHWIVGNSAHIIGIACIFLANDLAAANLGKDEYMFITMGAVLFHIVMHLILSFHTLWADKRMETKTKRAVVPGPMKPNGLSSEAPGTGFRSFMLALYFLGLAGCAAALIYYVCRPLDVQIISA